jgi:signal transduction histidine kinase
METVGKGEWLKLTVGDTGIGIAPDKFDTLFDSFTQADNTTTRRFGGTGLGLAISQRYCELLEGNIGVASQPGEGSVFTVRLPLQRPDVAKAAC